MNIGAHVTMVGCQSSAFRFDSIMDIADPDQLTGSGLAGWTYVSLRFCDSSAASAKFRRVSAAHLVGLGDFSSLS
jgi:hypothetical protein